MRAFSYRNTPYVIRPDLPAAYRTAWQMIARAGNWWTGAERVAIADEVRRAHDCRLCAERKTALSPYAVAGDHDHAGVLPPAAVEAAHRITTDPARLKQSWYEELLTPDFTDAHYVELVGVVVAVVSVDAFHHALDLPIEPLPVPVPRAPSWYRPASVKPGAAWVPMITRDDARGTAEEDIYPGERTGHVIMAMSLVPDAVRMLHTLSNAQYLDFVVDGFTTASHRALSRPQIELVAARVSILNQCFY